MVVGDPAQKFLVMGGALVDGGVPSTGDDLLGMALDCDYHLSASEILDKVVVVTTPDPAHLLDITATGAPQVTDAQVEEELVRIWSDCLRYPYGAEHLVVHDARGTTMRAVTAMARYGIYVTLTITVTRTAQPY